MRVCLIIPPSGFLLDERVFPSLGVLKVAAALEATGHDVSVLDCSGFDDEQIARALVGADGTDVFGVTATMPQMPKAAEIAQWLSICYPEAQLILGGPHPTLLNASAKRGVTRARTAMEDLGRLFDVIVCGDGERAIFPALTADPADMPLILDVDDPKSQMWMASQDLTDAPLPARHLIDLASYRYQIDGHKTASLIAQLGCPFGCHFCGGRRSPFLRRVRLRSTASVIDEMRHLHDTYGYTGFMFLDDELNVNREFLTLLDAIIDLQHSLGTEFRLRGLVKSELVTAPMAARMFDAGFRQLLIGFESGSDRMLTNMNKHATVADNTRCVELLRAAGITVKALMSLGHPGENAESAMRTNDWLLDVRPDDFDVTIITVYPGTPYYDDAVATVDGNQSQLTYTYTARNGDRLYMLDTDHLRDVNFYKGIPGNYQSFVWTDALSRERLVQWRDEIEATVRSALNIPYPTAPAARQYEHSMGMSAGR